jgi:DNA-binding response OmpR family regulator
MQKTTVLVVEDEKDVRNILTEIVSLLGLNYDMAANGIEAWYKIQNSNYDLIITDLGLPLMDGIELVGKIRNLGNKTPVILIAGIDMKCKKKDLSQFSDCEYIEKPFTVDDIKTKINKLLKTDHKLNNCPRSDCHK